MYCRNGSTNMDTNILVTWKAAQTFFHFFRTFLGSHNINNYVQISWTSAAIASRWAYISVRLYRNIRCLQLSLERRVVKACDASWGTNLAKELFFARFEYKGFPHSSAVWHHRSRLWETLTFGKDGRDTSTFIIKKF